MSVRDRIESFEERFLALPPSKRVMLGLSLVMLVVLGFYYFLFEPQLAAMEANEAHLADLDAKIAKRSTKTLESKILKLKREVLAAKEEVERAKQKQYSVLAELKAHHYLFFDEASFSKILDDMLADSYKKGIELHNITILDSDREFLGRLFETKRVEVEGRGEFLNLVRFLRNIEAHKMLLQIQELAIETNGTMPRFTFEIRFFGAKL